MLAPMKVAVHAGVPGSQGLADHLVAFWAFFTACLPPAARGVLSVRDLLACASFVQVICWISIHSSSMVAWLQAA